MLNYAIYPTKFGPLKIGYEGNAVTLFTILTAEPESLGTRTPLTDFAYRQWEEYLLGNRRTLDFPVQYHGTAFQMQVWEALKTIPYGQTRTYKEIAQQIDHPKAYRAVGQANHRNPLILVIPCHRVIAENGKLAGYACGTDMKMELLKLEREYSHKFI